MSSSSLTQVFGPEDVVELAARAAEHEAVSGGYLLKIGKSEYGQAKYSVLDELGPIAVAHEEPAYPDGTEWRLVVLTADGHHLPSITMPRESDALAWLTYLADLHTTGASS